MPCKVHCRLTVVPERRLQVRATIDLSLVCSPEVSSLAEQMPVIHSTKLLDDEDVFSESSTCTPASASDTFRAFVVLEDIDLQSKDEAALVVKHLLIWKAEILEQREALRTAQQRQCPTICSASVFFFRPKWLLLG